MSRINAQIKLLALMQNVKFFGDSKIYKVMANILIENRGETYYSYYSEWGLSQHKTTKLMEE